MKPLNKVTTLVYHHTGTPNMTIEAMKKSMMRHWWRIPAHYIVWANWWFQKIKQNEWLNVGSTRNVEVNMEAIQIETIWNFNNKRPSIKQYETLGQLTEWIEKKYWKLKKIWHREASPTSCPWKFFDKKMVRKDLITFKISRYYSPVKNQKRYYPWRTGWYLADKKMNCWVTSNCLVTASWLPLRKEYAGKIVACPKWYKLWTKFYIENYWIVTCKDRGWAINKQNWIIRLDLRMWIWDKWLNNLLRKSSLVWIRNGFIIK